MKITTLSIVIPVYNEELTIKELLNKVNGASLIDSIKKEVIVINDASTDNTENLIKEYIENYPTVNIKYKKHEKNIGKGGAIKTALELATGEYVIIQDADLECNPDEYNVLLKPVVTGFADVVYGSRFVGGLPRRVLPYKHRLANKILTTFSNLLTGLSLTDMATCYKLISLKHLKSFNIKEKRFAFDPEVTAKIAKIKGIRMYEVGISYYARTKNDGKKIGWKDAIRAIYCIAKYKF